MLQVRSWDVQTLSRPRRQLRQVPQRTNGTTVTRVPT
jgi:hypothetical protein